MRRDPRMCGLFVGGLLLCLFFSFSAADDTSQTLSPEPSFVFDNEGQDVFLAVEDSSAQLIELDADAEKPKGKKGAKDVATNPEHVQKQVETVGKNVDAKLTKDFDETRTVAETVGVYVSNMGKTLKTTDPVVQKEFERRPRNIQYQPQVYLSKPKDWGCCRLCTSKPRPRPLKPVVIRDPSRFVNCCPFCPVPPLNRNKKKGLGPYQYYFEKRYPTQNDLYESHLVATYKEHLPEPTNRDKPYEDIRRWQIEKMAQEGIQQENSDAGLTLLELDEEGPGGGSKGGKPEEVDPYQTMRGFNMDREKNYVYGFPEDPLPPEAVGVPYAGRVDLPPCCTVCTRKTHTLSLDSEQGCCVQCAVTLGNAPTWRTRRERYADEQAFKGRAGKKKKGGKKK